MTQIEYFNYLKSIPQLNLDDEFENIDMEDQLYALFQCFMPEGTGVDKVFTPLDKGTLLLERILPIYSVTEEAVKDNMKGGAIPGYFVPPHISLSEKELKDTGYLFINYMKSFGKYLEDEEFVCILDKMTIVEILPDRECLEERRDDITDWIYDAVSDWAIENRDSDSLINILSEAYYSISCDYWLSYYFQYPAFGSRPEYDLFKPYFELWAKGYICIFNEKGLVIAPY